MATSGTTVLGAFDDLNAVADVCEKHKVWMHVDVSNEIKANGLYMKIRWFGYNAMSFLSAFYDSYELYPQVYNYIAKACMNVFVTIILGQIVIAEI